MSVTRIPLAQVFRSRSSTISSTSSDSAIQFRAPPPQLPPLQPTTTAGMSQPIQVIIPKGTRTPQMLEYERVALLRLAEAEKMNTERELMLNTEMQMRKEQERIAQEEYEMKQYYEAEALKHAEEVRMHAEEVRRHQERVREHERRVQDHEASSEAFARVIAMPVQERGRGVSIYEMGRVVKGMNGNGSFGSSSGGSPT